MKLRRLLSHFRRVVPPAEIAAETRVLFYVGSDPVPRAIETITFDPQLNAWTITLRKPTITETTVEFGVCSVESAPVPFSVERDPNDRNRLILKANTKDGAAVIEKMKSIVSSDELP